MRSKALALSLALVLVAACNRGHQRRIAVIPKGTSHLFWLSVEAGAKEAGKQFHVDVIWNGPTQETEYDRQMQILDSFVAQHVDGIAIAAAERKALVVPVERAAQEKIPVVVFDSGLDTTMYTAYIATDNVEGGRMAGRTLGKLLGGKGKAALLMHAPGSASTMDREKGFREVMVKEFPDIRIVAEQYGLSDRAKALAACENILTANPDLNGIFASSEPSSVGAALAVKSRGVKGKVHLVAFDSSEGLIEDLKGGTVDAMVVQDPFKMGFEAVKTLVDKLDGKPVSKQIDLSARVITKADLSKPEIQKLLHPVK